MNFTEKYNYALRNIQPPGCGNGTHGRHDEPGIMRKTIRTVTECITYFQNGGKTSPFIIINPLTGKEGLTKDGNPSYRSDPCVKELRCATAEFDNLSREEQIRSWSAVKLLIVAPIGTGGKSIHTWIDVQKLAKVDTAEDWGEYIKNGLYDAALIDMGVDAACSNPPLRLSCLPGHYREEKGQLWLSAEGRHIS